MKDQDLSEQFLLAMSVNEEESMRITIELFSDIANIINSGLESLDNDEIFMENSIISSK